ncbi:MAG: DUF192 domain-containing protein [Nanoarchaeota archaeon]|nr:DUF192 domain-containing protein [Nanoarchaeota archaeon]
MKKKKIIIRGGSKFSLDVYQCNSFERIIGLMFSRRESAKALMFEFSYDVKMPIHSWFVFYPFVVLWLDKNNKILEKKVVTPWAFSISPSKKYKKLVEIPINSNYNKILHVLDDNSKDLKRILI